VYHWGNWKGELKRLKQNLESGISTRVRGGVKKRIVIGRQLQRFKQYIKTEISKGFRPDIVIVVYIDCNQPLKAFHAELPGEGK